MTRAPPDAHRSLTANDLTAIPAAMSSQLRASNRGPNSRAHQALDLVKQHPGWTAAASVVTLAAGLVALHRFRLARPAWRHRAQALLQLPSISPTSVTSSVVPGGVWIITGASSGIGRSTALALRKAGWRVLLAVRSIERGVAAKEWIESNCGVVRAVKERGLPFDPATQDPHANILILRLEVGDGASTRRFVHQLKQLQRSGVRFAGCINNAGMMSAGLVREVDSLTGWETTIQTNHFGLADLTEQVLPLLQASAQQAAAQIPISIAASSTSSLAPRARIVNVGSRMESMAHFDLEDPHFERRPWSATSSYAWSKRLMMLWAFERTRRLAKEPGNLVDMVSMTPGMVVTNIQRGTSLKQRFGAAVFNNFLARPASVAAESVLFSCIAPIRQDGVMEYLGECGRVTPSPASQDEAAQGQVAIWTAAELERVRQISVKDFRTREQRLTQARTQQSQMPTIDDPFNTIRVFRIPVETPSCAPGRAASRLSLLPWSVFSLRHRSIGPGDSVSQGGRRWMHTNRRGACARGVQAM